MGYTISIGWRFIILSDFIRLNLEGEIAENAGGLATPEGFAS